MSYEFSLEPATLLSGASQPSRTNGAIFPDAAYIVSRARTNQCTFGSRDSACFSKQLKNRSSRPRVSEAADRGKQAYPDGELQRAENSLEEGASLRSK